MTNSLHSSVRHALTAALFALLAVLVAACSGLQSPPGASSGSASSSSAGSSAPKVTSPFDPTTTPAAPTGPMLAYRAADEIGIIDGTTKIATVQGPFRPATT